MGTSLFASVSAALFSDLKRYITSVPDGTVRDRHLGVTTTDDLSGFRARQLLNGYVKRLVDPDSEVISLKDRQLVALEGFLNSNSKCQVLNQTLSETPVILGLRSILEGWLNKPSYYIVDGMLKVQTDPSVDTTDLLRNLTVGPGASVGAAGDSFFEKMCVSTLTSTKEDLLRIFTAHTANHPIWSIAERHRAERLGSRIVMGSKLSFAPKNAKTERVIATEPSVNMLFQLSLGRQLTNVLKRRLSIDLAKQPEINRSLARLGSIDGSYATIDLASASDSVSRRLINLIFPRDWTWWFEFLRSPFTEVNGQPVELHMISSMGNGFTFPLQTIIFSAVVKLAFQLTKTHMTKNSIKAANWAVFGDDIIVPTHLYPVVVDILSQIGFTVNKDKSFNCGPFRESCGSDWLSGSDVRPVMPKSISTLQSRYVFLNRLAEWSAVSGILLPETFRTVLESCDHLNLVPLYEAYDSGLRVPFSLTIRKQVGITGPLLQNGLYVFQAYRPCKTELRILKYNGEPTREWGQWKVTFHPALASLAIAYGGVTAPGVILARTRHTRYSLRELASPVWDTTVTNAVESVLAGGVRRDPDTVTERRLSSVLEATLWDYFYLG